MPRRTQRAAPRVGNRLREWREYRGFTQKQAAELIGVSQSYLSQMEAGKADWNQQMLESASWVYQTSPAALLHANPGEHGEAWAAFLNLMEGDETTIAAVTSYLRFLQETRAKS